MSGVLERDVRAPDLLGPLEAWRAWRLVRHGDGFLLGSVVRRTTWPAGEALVAGCLRARSPLDWLRRRASHAAPSAPCECGVYGADLEIAARYLCDAGSAPAHVIGVVSLWGSVVECEHGFRASHAYPLRIYVPANAGRGYYDVAAIAAGLAVYGVGVELLASPAADARAALAGQEAA